MYVAHYGHWRTNVNDIRLAHQDLLGLLAYFAQERLVEELFSKQLLDACV